MNKTQGGDNKINERFYSNVFSFIRRGDEVLNLGCGNKFVFEKALYREKGVCITSVDILENAKPPSCIKAYIQQSVEDAFILPQKFDVITFFELIEHIDKTDELLRNCHKNLKTNGLLIFSMPNLASIYSRVELFLGYQPHILEISNEFSNYGTGIFGKINNPKGESIHHIRGITNIAMKEMLRSAGFRIIKIIGYDHHNRLSLFYRVFPSISPINIFVCKKEEF